MRKVSDSGPGRVVRGRSERSAASARGQYVKSGRCPSFRHRAGARLAWLVGPDISTPFIGQMNQWRYSGNVCGQHAGRDGPESPKRAGFHSKAMAFQLVFQEEVRESIASHLSRN